MKKLFLCFALVGMASTLCAQERGDMLVSGSLSWSSSSTKTTVIKQDGDNKVSNRDFSLGLNVGATIAFNYYFCYVRQQPDVWPHPLRPRKRQVNNPGSKSRNNVTIYRKPKSQRLKHPRNHKQSEPMKLINIARSILVIGYVMLVSCSSDEGGESGNGPQATGQELERQLLDTHWKLA